MPLQPFKLAWGAARQLGITLTGGWILPGQCALIVLCLNPKYFSPGLKALWEHNLQVQTEEKSLFGLKLRTWRGLQGKVPSTRGLFALLATVTAAPRLC